MDNSTHNMSEKLVQYLDGELTGAEKESIEQQLAADKNLQEELESLKATREAVKIFGLQQKVSGIHQQMMQEMQSPVKKISSTRRIIRYGIAVAASVVLIVGCIIGYNFYTLSSNKVFASNYHSYELSTVRSDDTAQISPVEKAYREKDYKKTVELISQQSSLTVKETFLAGMSYMELNNSTKAIDEFKKVIAGNENAKSNLFKDEAEYYLALTYISNKDYDFALDILRTIKENPEHLYHEKVTTKLIRQIKMLKWR
jgi:predicted negative regulator of RcsB-dependent stress response